MIFWMHIAIYYSPSGYLNSFSINTKNEDIAYNLLHSYNLSPMTNTFNNMKKLPVRFSKLYQYCEIHTFHESNDLEVTRAIRQRKKRTVDSESSTVSQYKSIRYKMLMFRSRKKMLHYELPVKKYISVLKKTILSIFSQICSLLSRNNLFNLFVFGLQYPSYVKIIYQEHLDFI